MVPLVEAVVLLLQQNPAVAAALPGGVYQRDLKREGPGATPQAYAPTPPYVPRPAAVVVDDGEGAALVGPPHALLGFVSVWFYASRTTAGREAISEAVESTRTVLVDPANWMALPSGPPVRLEGPGQRLGTRDDPVDPQRIVERLTLPYAAVWRLQ